MGNALAVIAGLLALAATAVGVIVLGTFLIVRTAVRRTRSRPYLSSLLQLGSAVQRRSPTPPRSAAPLRSALRLRSAVIPVGTRGEIGRLRWSLHTNLRQTERVLNSQVIIGTGPNPFADLLPPLQQTARALDRHLALIEREPDVLLRKALLPRLSSRADQVIADSTALRGAAYGLADEVHVTTAEPLITDVRDRIAGLLGAMQDLRSVR
jgi:hypothetical protein